MVCLHSVHQHHSGPDAALEHIDGVLVQLETSISLLDKQIVGSLKLQQPAVASGRDQVLLAKQRFEALAKLVTDITTYFSQLADAQDALSATDVLVLETTKRNVSHIVKTLSDCRLLMSTIEQLQPLLHTDRYGHAAQLFTQCSAAVRSFDNYMDVKQVSDLIAAYHDLQNLFLADALDLLQQYTDDTRPVTHAVAGAACRLAQAIGSDAQSKVIDLIIRTMAAEYARVFPDDKDSLESAEMRMKWLISAMQIFSEKYDDVLPVQWKGHVEALAALCEITRRKLAALFEKQGKPIPIDTVVSLAKAAREMEAAFSTRIPPDAAELCEISSAVEAALTTSVKLQQTSWVQMVQQQLADETWEVIAVDALDAAAIPHVAKDLVYAFRAFVNKILAITNRQPLYNLSVALNTCLTTFGKAMNARLEKEERKRSLSDTQLACMVQTAQYMCTNTEQLAELMVSKADAAFASSISFVSAVEQLEGAVSRGLSLLVARATSATPLTGTVDWNKVAEGVKQCSSVPRARLSQLLFNFYCINVAKAMAAAFQAVMFKQKLTDEKAVVRVSMDAELLKSALLTIGGDNATPLVISRIQREMGKVQQLIALFKVPVDSLADAFAGYLRSADNAHVSELKSILDCRGVSKKQQQAILAQFPQTPPASHVPIATGPEDSILPVRVLKGLVDKLTQ